MLARQLLNNFWHFCIGFLIAISPLRVVAARVCSEVFAAPSESIEAGFVYFGVDIQPRILSLISRAKSQIDIEMYMEDVPALMDLLKQKAQQDVKIRVILDGRSLQLSKVNTEILLKVKSNLESFGAEVVISDPEALQAYRGHPIAVLHRKLINVDDQFFYVGSATFRDNRNLDVGYFGPLKTDFSLKDIFETDLQSIREKWKNSPFLKEAIAPGSLAEGEIQLVGPGTSNPSFLDVLLGAIRNAKSDILISSFEASDPTILKALIDKKREIPAINIKVLLCGGKLNVYAGLRRFRVEKNAYYKEELRKAGIEVREFYESSQYNHSRLGIFDDVIYGSSADFVERSFSYSVDLGFVMRDKSIANWNKDIFDRIWFVQSQSSAKVKFGGLVFDSLMRISERMAIWVYAVKLRVKGALQ